MQSDVVEHAVPKGPAEDREAAEAARELAALWVDLGGSD